MRFSLPTVLILSILLLAPMPETARAQTLRDTVLTMSDGVALDAFYVRPLWPEPAGGYPAVLLVHGFGGSKGNNASLARDLAQLGYAATAYSVRGQGASGGMFDFFTSDRLLADLQTMVDFTKALPGINSDRVGVMGASQGGLHAWNAVAFDMGARAVISIVANGRFRENWLEDGALNWTFAAAAQTPSVNFDPAVLDSINRALQSVDFTYLRSFLTDASTKSHESGVTTPVLMISSYFDGFFDPTAALRQFAGITAPKRMILYPAGHSLPTNPVQAAYAADVIARWLDYWLRDNQDHATVASPDSALCVFDIAKDTMRIYRADEEAYWLPETMPLPQDIEEITLYLTDGGLADQAQQSRTDREIAYTGILASEALTFRSNPLTRDLVIAPRAGKVRLRLAGTGAWIQANALLFEESAGGLDRRFITRGHIQVEGGEARDVAFELNAALCTVEAGHNLQLLVHCGLARLPEQGRTFGNYVVGPLFVSIDTISWGGDAESAIHLNVYTDETSGVEDGVLPVATQLRQNYPNPFTSTTSIPLSVGESGSCRLSVYDSRGREVAVLHDGFLSAGRYAMRFNAGVLPAGVYVAVLHSRHAIQRQLMMLVR